MPEKKKDDPTPTHGNIVVCPLCETEVDLDAVDECSKCGLNVQQVVDHDRHERAMEAMRKRREQETPPEPGKKKKGDKKTWSPF